MSTEVLVVGGGACGLVAALRAADLGARVVVLEKEAQPAGNTARSTGLIPAAGTKLQREAGIADDSPELMARDILEKNHQSNPVMTKLLCELAASTVEWLSNEVGCELVCHTDFLYPGQSRLRMHGPKSGYGAELLRQLEKFARQNRNIELRAGESATGLLWDGVRVNGAQTTAGDLDADATILALNGFGGDGEMVERYLGAEARSALYFGSEANRGEGIEWGMDLGAATEHMGSYQGHASVAAPDGPLVTWGVIVEGAVLVNRAGERFGCETVGYSEFAGKVFAQPGAQAWEIFDEEVFRAARGTRFEEVIKAGRVLRTDSLGSLAAAFGLPYYSLADTVKQANRAARGEISDHFGREDFRGGPLEPPFYGIHVRGALFHTQGGLKVDTAARVLRRDGSPIGGLYAGGGTAVGVSGSGYEGYSSGNGLLAATVLGKIAGESAAEDAGPTERVWGKPADS